ncbi:thioredoxin-disulfide reductase [Methanolobus sp. ZRKC3]|uniref:thioredoxin-disulfide reductase n=1 Tax=Methanolobus sp. ZRKC3 TaxID=3125786 RepID=UPI003244EA2F
MYDIIIVGGGPAGLTAAIYAVRYGLNILVLEKNVVPGQIATTDAVENYPGFTTIAGLELMDRFKEHAVSLGVEVQTTEVKKIEDGDGKKTVITHDGELEAKAVIIATGANPKHLGVPGEEEMIAKGVSYCATCDGPFFSGEEVIVIGGGESALTDALILSNIASKVYVIHRRDQLRSSRILQERAFSKDNIEFIWDTGLEKIVCSDAVEGVVLKNVKTGETTEMDISGVFIYIGIVPNTWMVDVEKNEQGFIKATEKMKTSVGGIFAAGDCRVTPLWQVVTAVADGAIAAVSAYEYIEGLELEQ